MKRCLLLLLALCLLWGFVGCTPTQPTHDVHIVCSIFPQYDFLREITKGADVSLTLLLRPGQESHDYDPSSKDIAALHNCDMFVYVGGHSDDWIDKTLQSVDIGNKTVLRLMDMVPPLCEDEHHHEQHDHDHEETYDEHVWTAPKNAVRITEQLTAALCTLDGDNAALYRENAKAYTEKLTALDADFQQTVANAKRKTIVVADRFPLLHFTESYGISYHAAFAGCAASVEPAGADVQALIDTVRTQQIPVIFQMELSAGVVANTVSEHTDSVVRTFYSCHNVSRTDFENGESYLSLMQKNLETLKEALN